MDLNAINASKMGMFKNAVNRQADREIEEITAKIREQRNTAERVHEEHKASEEMSKINAERAAIEAQYRRELSRCDFDVNKDMLEYRKELVTKFFGEVRADISAFTEGKDYDDYLKKRIKSAEDALGSGCVILASPKDEKRVAALTKHAVRSDKAITLGGICALDEERGLFLDLSLDKALEDEINAFSDRPELRA